MLRIYLLKKRKDDTPITENPTVMVILCDWATGHPDIRSNFILQYLEGCFWMRLTFELVDGVSRLPSLMWVGLIQ